MQELAQFCKSLKRDFKPRDKNLSKPVKCWSEKDTLNNEIIDTFVIIFKTRGCSWALKSGCSMCGYFNDSAWENVTDKDFLNQFESAMSGYSNERFVKIFNSGSFLDKNEVSEKVRNKILSELSEKTDKVSVESRPEFVNEKTLSGINKIIGSTKFEVGIGLESADDFVRENAINKGFSFKDYEKAVNLLKKYDFSVKTYVTIKPPFLTEKQSIRDCINSVNKIANMTDLISFNPVNVQRNTLVDYLFKRKQYRPAWLWSVIDILRKSKDISNAHLKCDIVGGGSIRGAHNCKVCDKDFIKAISEFSLDNKTELFENLKCDCKEKWLDQLDFEDLGFGSFIDFGDYK